jgi:hypothetical protein
MSAITVIGPPAAKDNWSAVVLRSFYPQSQTARYVGRVLPFIVILGAQALFTLRLSNSAFSDEGLYIDAGHQLLAQWNGGAAPTQDYASYFSGLPWAYPILAGALDSLGGLGLVRFASLAMMLVASVCVYATAKAFAPAAVARRVGLGAMAFMAISAPTLFVGNLATYDAACVMFVAIALYLAVCRASLLSAAFAALAVVAAGVDKYVGLGFIPVIVVLAASRQQNWKWAVLRAEAVAATAGALVLAFFLPLYHQLYTGIKTTTAARVAQSPRSSGFLLAQAGRGIGILLILALVGLAAMAVRRDFSALAAGTVMIGGGLAVPLSQLRIHEYTSFNKHLVFACLLLAPIAGQVLAVRARQAMRCATLALAGYLIVVFALSRSQSMFSEWPDTTRVASTILAQGRAGSYISVDANGVGYYTKAHLQFDVEEPYALFYEGRDAIRSAVESGAYEGYALTSGSTGTRAFDANVAYLSGLLQQSGKYHIVGTWPKHKYDLNRWFVWLRNS